MSLRSWPLSAVVVLIALATLLPTPESVGVTGFCPLCVDRGVADFISNIILFSPFGAAIALRGGGMRHAVIAAGLFAGAIEVLQIDLITGRDANIADIAANAAGAAVGWLVGWWRPWREARAFGLRASGTMTALTCGSLLTGLFLLRPVLPPPPYHLFWTPKYDNQEQYFGRVLSTQLGPVEWRRDSIPMEPAASVGQLLETNPLEARFLAGPAPYRVAPIVTIHAGGREVIRLGAGGHDFVHRHWGAADVLRLDHADLRIPRVFEGVAEGDTVDLSFAFGRRGYCVEVNERSRCGHGFAVGDTWTLLISPDWSVARFQVAAVAWLWLVFLPCGYVTSSKRRVAALAAAATVCLAAVSLALGFAVTPWYQLVGVVLGLFSGYIAAGAYRHLGGPPGGSDLVTAVRSTRTSTRLG